MMSGSPSALTGSGPGEPDPPVMNADLRGRGGREGEDCSRRAGGEGADGAPGTNRERGAIERGRLGYGIKRIEGAYCKLVTPFWR